MPQVQAQISDEDLSSLLELARRRGVDANTVLRQAIRTAKLISDNVGPKDDLIVKHSDNTISTFQFSKPGK
jgi:hypothetical protein